MNLDTYLQRHGAGANLARSLGVTQVMVSQWRYGIKQVPAERCPAIEKATGGEVRCEDLRPDIDWGYLRDTSKVGAGETAPAAKEAA